MKTCFRCKQTFDTSSFNNNKRCKDGLSSYCKACVKQTVAEWQKANPEKTARNKKRWQKKNQAVLQKKRREREKADPQKTVFMRAIYARRSRLKKRGITDETLVRKLENQKSICPLCFKKLTPSITCIDHDHVTGKTRDLLCRDCNFSLGHVERPGFLEAALGYIARHRSQP